MKAKRISLLIGLGLALSATVSWAVDCVNDPVPCEGPEVLNGWGCSTGCPPSNPNVGCCLYEEFRVNCDEGPDQFYRKRTCFAASNCGPIVIPKKLQCTHL